MWEQSKCWVKKKEEWEVTANWVWGLLVMGDEDPKIDSECYFVKAYNVQGKK